MKKEILAFVLFMIFVVISSQLLLSCNDSQFLVAQTELFSIDATERFMSDEEIVSLAKKIPTFSTVNRVVEILGREGDLYSDSPYSYIWKYDSDVNIIIVYGERNGQDMAWRILVTKDENTTLYDTWDNTHYLNVRLLILGADSEFYEFVLPQEESRKVRDAVASCKWIEDRNILEGDYWLLLSSNDMYRYNPSDGKLDNCGLNYALLSEDNRNYVNALIERYEKQMKQ